MTIPLYVLGDASRSSPRVLGLPLWKHSHVVGRRAGFEPRTTPPSEGRVLVVDQDMAVTRGALETIATASIAEGGLAVSEDRGIALTDAPLLEGAAGIAAVVEKVSPDELITLPTKSIRVGERRERGAAATLLLRDACKKLKPGDYFGVINRELTLPLTRWMAPTGLSPNLISFLGFAFVVAATVPLSKGTYFSFLLGAFLQWVGSLFDGVDGKIARLKAQTSPLGCWIDTALDYVYYLLLLGAIAVGVSKSWPKLAMGLGGAAVLGALIAVLFLSGMRRRLAPPEHPELFGPRMYAFLERHKGDPVLGFAHRTIRFATRAALPHLVLVAGILGGLPLVLMVAAVGTHLIWMIAVRVDRLAMREQATGGLG